MRSNLISNNCGQNQNIIQNVQSIIDFNGNKTAVIVPIEDYEEMLEDLHFGNAARESEGEPKRDFNEFLEELRENGEA